MVRSLLVATGCLLASTGFSQSISSFNYAEITGVLATLSGNQVSLTVGNAPTLKYNNVIYNITEVFGVYALDQNDDMAATGAAQNGWTFDTNFAGVGGIAGWKTNPNSGSGANSNLTFNYTTLTGTVEDMGYHIRVAGSFPGGGNTAYFRNQVVPEPASMVALAGVALGILRKRKSA